MTPGEGSRVRVGVDGNETAARVAHRLSEVIEMQSEAGAAAVLHGAAQRGALAVVPHLVLSTSDELRLPLRWIGILRSQLKTSLAATSGVHSAEDALKVLLAGADAAMLASALLSRGPALLGELERGLLRWLDERECSSIEQLKGSVSQSAATDPEAFERANYLRTFRSFASSSHR